MSFIDKHNCMLCKYKKYNKDNEFGCWEARGLDEHGYPIGKCHSLSNIYYGTICKYFPFKQIEKLKTEIAWYKENEYLDEMDRKYGDSSIETDELKHIWGVKSWDDLSGAGCCLCSMNDIDITYDKQKKEYVLGIKTAYIFETHEAECKYLQKCLEAFTKYMDDNGLNKNEPFRLFMGMGQPCTSMVADSIEELYTNFKIFVDGFCNQDIDMKEKIS